jgi:hypothetical protein
MPLTDAEDRKAYQRWKWARHEARRKGISFDEPSPLKREVPELTPEPAPLLAVASTAPTFRFTLEETSELDALEGQQFHDAVHEIAEALAQANGWDFRTAHEAVCRALRWAREDSAWREAMDARRRLIEAAAVATLECMKHAIGIAEIDFVINQRRMEMNC